MSYIYAPNHTVADYMDHARKHVGHKLEGDFTNGRGGHTIQTLTLQSILETSNEVRVSNQYGETRFSVAEFWAYGTPQCLTCGS